MAALIMMRNRESFMCHRDGVTSKGYGDFRRSISLQHNQLTDKHVLLYNIIRYMKLKATYTRRILAMMYFPDCEPANAVCRR